MTSTTGARSAALTTLNTDTGWTRWLPGLRVARSYQRVWLRQDLVAGLVMTTMLVPVGIAYAEASGVPGIFGLYATIVPLLAYAVFGPNPILVLGPDSALAAVILATVAPLSGGDAVRAVAVAGAMALVSGAVCVVAGVARLGFVTELLSKPIRYGYMNGIALTVLLSQTPKLLGFSIDSTGPVRGVWAIGQGIVDGKTNLMALAIGGATLVAILALKRFPRVPGILVAVVGATLAVTLLDLGSGGGGAIKVLGVMPRGLPMPRLPLIGVDDLVPVVTGGIAVALISFADTSVLSRTYAAKLRTPVDPNQEMVGLGVANLAAGFFQGFPISSSSSRTPVAEAAGSRTQLTGVVGALSICVLLLFAPALLKNLPNAALAAVVIASAIGLFEVADLRRIYRIQRWEFWLSMVCFVGVATLGAIQGIALAIVIAVIEFLWDGWRPHSAVLGRVVGVEGYHDITRYPDATLIPGLLLFRWDAPLFFANAELFCERVHAAIAAAPEPVRCCVVAAEPVTSVDVTAADVVAELDDTLHAAGTELCFAEMKDPVKDKLKRFGLFSRLGAEGFFATIDEAVAAYRSDRAARDTAEGPDACVPPATELCR
jgi:high affinity sulfate transporter 1